MNTIRFYDAERDALMTKVERGIRGFCRARNLFAWEDLIDDCLSMVAHEMCRRDFKGTPQFYISIGKQLAQTGARERSVLKRRGNFDVTMRVNIDDAYDLGEMDENMGIMTPELKEDEIIKAVKQNFGDKVALYVEGIFKGTELVDKKGKELSEARLAQMIKRELKDEGLQDLKEIILSFNEDRQI